jgi:heme exporter protein A
MTKAVSLDEVSYRFGARWALVRLTLDIQSGKTLLLTGRNGAGKTTFLRLLATALTPHFGNLQIFGCNPKLALASTRSNLALLTHQSYFYDLLSSKENLVLYARLRGCDEGRIDDLLEEVGLAADAHRPILEFSAGMKRRLGMARLLLASPKLALFDEPFGQLDPQGVSLVEEIIDRLRNQGCTVVMSTHDIERGLSLADERMHLEQGRLESWETLRA